jgi:hypothetical protein
MRSVSYQREVGDYFLQELPVLYTFLLLLITFLPLLLLLLLLLLL